MKILYDLSNHSGLYWGLTVYAMRILQGFKALGYKNIVLLVSDKIYSDVHELYPEYECIIVKHNHIKLKNAYHWTKAVKSSNCDILFSPAPDLYYLKSNLPIIQTIHDLQPLRIDHGISLIIYRFLMPFLLKRSKKIIAISNFVKEDILKTYPFMSSQKLKTIYNGVISNSEERELSSLLNEDRYILYISTLYEYKNIITLIKAFNLIKEKILHKLVVIGRITPYWTNTILPLIEKYNLEARIVHISNFISDKELFNWYNNADLFVHPSLQEGFGYTPIEAAIYSIPVITTKETALYETTLGLLNYYEPPMDYEALSNTIMKILNNPPDKKELEQIANRYLLEYDYKKQAKKIYEYINESYNHIISK